MSMVDSVLLVVDAQDGPMPQTRFVTQKAFKAGLRPIVVVNKIDRPGARPDWVIDQIFDLFDNLGATDEQLDFPIVYASALNGIAGLDHEKMDDNMDALFQAIIDHVPAPVVDTEGPFQMQISQLDYNSFLGVIGIGRITRGKVKSNTPVVAISDDGSKRNGRILKIMGHHGLQRVEVAEAEAGDIVCVSGMEELFISDTLCDPQNVEALPPLTVDQPTVSMTFQVNDSPFAGREGKFVTSRNIKERLEKELLHNVALRVEPGDSPEKFKVSGRGELHLSVLIETMRREGFELAVGRPEVVIIEKDGEKQEPYENVTIDIEEQHQGSVMEQMGLRKGDLSNMIPRRQGPRAPGVHHSGARPDRLPQQLPDPDLGHRHPDLDLQPLRSDQGRRSQQPPERRTGLHGHRHRPDLLAGDPAEPRQAVPRPGRRNLRRPVGRHQQP